MTTSGFSIVYALVLFTVVMGLVGPEGDQGSLKHIWNALRCRVTTTTTNDTSNDNSNIRCQDEKERVYARIDGAGDCTLDMTSERTDNERKSEHGVEF